MHYVGEVGEDTFIKSAYDYICESPIEWADMGEVYDCACFGDEIFEFRKGTKAFTEYFVNLFPEEKEAIEEYLDIILSMGDYGIGYYANKMGSAYESKDFAQQLSDKFLNYASRTTQSVMDELFKSQKLKGILTAQYGNIGLTPSQSSFAMHAGIVRHYMEGGFYPIGGSNVFFEKIAPVITKAGGEILVRAVVTEIIVENDKAIGVKMSDGKSLFAETIISTVGVDITFNKLLSEDIQTKFGITQKIKPLTNSISYCCLYLGLKHSAKELGIPTANFWIFPDEYDHEKSSSDYFSVKTDKKPIVYISFPGAKDPDFEKRYPNKCTIEIIILESYDKYKAWENTRWKHRGEEYDLLKESLSNELLEYLYHYVPTTKGKIDYMEFSTPLTAKHFAGHNYGELYGVNHTPERYHNTLLKPETPIQNLFIAGQDIVTAGVAGGLVSAVICASVIKNTNYIDKIFWGE